MNRITWIFAIVISAATGVAIGKLPPLTPEQQETANQKKEAEKAKLEQEKVLLEKAQDRIVQHYKKTKGSTGGTSGGSTGGGKTEDTNMPKQTKELSAGPTGGTKQSAEAHSTPAK